MTLTPSIDAQSFEGFIDRLGAATDLTSGSPFADGVMEAADVYMGVMRDRYDEYAERGGDWPEHASSTIKQRGTNAPILIDKGQLRESMERGDAGHFLETESDRLTEGTIDPKARFHQDGTDRMPARKIMVEPDEATLEQVKQTAAHGLDAAAKEAAHG